uniref:Trissin n=1 Tax=Carausius morosus TaxID=7022 RepID=A0A6G4ZV97_CARMO|nr:trissin [Carausius morosus]
MAKGFRGSLLLAGLMLWCISTWTLALSCDSCGRECTSACGTRSFRTCCFNYLRKRSDSPGLRLELMVVPELTRFWSMKNTEEVPPSSRMQLVYNA